MRKSPIRLMSTQTKITHLLFVFTPVYTPFHSFIASKNHCESSGFLLGGEIDGEAADVVFGFLPLCP